MTETLTLQEGVFVRITLLGITVKDVLTVIMVMHYKGHQMTVKRVLVLNKVLVQFYLMRQLLVSNVRRVMQVTTLVLWSNSYLISLINYFNNIIFLSGHKCDLCIDGYSGDPRGVTGTQTPCKRCDCNGNIDVNSIGNCNTTTGECLKCIYNTYGSDCGRCLPGYYGDALIKNNCKSCSCLPLGTVQTSTIITRSLQSNGLSSSHLKNILLCNSATGQCDCKPNVMGRQCNQCVEGYWDLKSNEGCKPCECDLVGSYNRTCDDATGQCYCKPGVTGKKCNQCLHYHYNFSTEGCFDCACDPIGSKEKQCDVNGQCPCIENVEGRRCERCEENKYNKAAGCIDCPPCYNLVQDAVNEHRTKLADLTELLDEIERNPQIVEDINFEKQLREVGTKVNKLLDDARKAQGEDGSLIAQLEILKERIKKVQEIAGKIVEHSENIGTNADYGEQNITLAEKIIESANEALTSARRFLETEGRNALEKAKQRSDKFGQQSVRMSEIARESRNLADKHEQEAKLVEDLSKEALNISDTAYRLAKDALETQEANRNEINKLRSQLDDTTDLLLRTKKMSDEAKKEAGKAHSDALTMYTDINAIVVPKLDSDKYKQDAIEIIEQAKRILAEADDLLNRHGDTLNNTRFQLKDARDLLEEAIRQQQITDGLLAEVEAALEKAKQAVASGEKTLEDAQNTLKTLKEFDQLVQESKGKADQALQKVPEITKMITDAEEKTKDAESALGGALTDAIDARDIAREAQRIAETASTDADRIRGDAGQTKERATKLKEGAEDLAGDVAETANRMKGFEDQAKTDEGLAKDALEKANQAKTSAQEASSKVREAARTVDGILQDLGKLN